MVDPSPFNVSNTQSSQSANAAHVRALEERVASLEEALRSSAGGVASSTPLSLNREQRREMSRLGRNASGGPSAPPASKKHSFPLLRKHFRRLVYVGYGCIPGGEHLVCCPYPARGFWPKNARSSSVNDTTTSDSSSAEDELTTGNKIRLHLGRPYNDQINASQLRPVWRYMLTHRRQCGVPLDMTLEQLVALCAMTFDGWVTEYQRSLTPAGRKTKAAAKNRSSHRARRARKATARTVACRLDRYYFFSDGAKVAKAQGDAVAQRGAVRADIEFALQGCVMSDEEDEWIPLEDARRDNQSDDDMDEAGQTVRRRVAIPWRSADLISELEGLDKKRKRQTSTAVLPPTSLQVLQPGFVLPSSIRRWMVSRSWAEQNEEACVDVSDNAGPFEGKYAVARGAKDWGEDPDWSAFEDQNRDGDVDLPYVGGLGSRVRSNSHSSQSSTGTAQRILDAEFGNGDTSEEE